jgi:hypothetical protein
MVARMAILDCSKRAEGSMQEIRIQDGIDRLHAQQVCLVALKIIGTDWSELQNGESRCCYACYGLPTVGTLFL